LTKKSDKTDTQKLYDFLKSAEERVRKDLTTIVYGTELTAERTAYLVGRLDMYNYASIALKRCYTGDTTMQKALEDFATYMEEKHKLYMDTVKHGIFTEKPLLVAHVRGALVSLGNIKSELADKAKYTTPIAFAF
jgi:uncharacterized FlgJ-related protein